jgi:virginiamycin B lyase
LWIEYCSQFKPICTEIKLNNKCEMPLAITADENGIWYVSTKLGSLILYNYNDNSFVKYDIPTWGSRDKPIDNSNVWDIKNDPSGATLWFTDEKQNLIWKFNKNSKTFENFKIPAKDMSFGTIYPVSLDFDNNGNIYFVGIRSPTLWIGNINEMKGGTSNGISSVPLPIEIFGDIDKILISRFASCG